MKRIKSRNSGKKIWTSLLRTGALVAGLVTGYYHRVFGGSCYSTGPGTYLCTGAASATGNDAELHITPFTALTVTTAPGFGHDTSSTGSNALYLVGLGGATFTDNYSSDITGYICSILTRNITGDAVSITTTGTVTGTFGDGIYAFNTGTDLTISANHADGGTFGIYARQEGTGALSVTSTGTVTGTGDDGISAWNSSGTDLTVSANHATGGYYGIKANNQGSGALSVTATGTVTGTAYSGIWTKNWASGTDLTISANNVTGGDGGIVARNYGSGALSITATGTVTGAGDDGICAKNYASATDLTILANNAIGGDRGIEVRTLGSGALSVTATGTVTGIGGDGLYAANDGAGDMTVSVNNVYANQTGIAAFNTGSDALSLTATGTVTGATLIGIRAFSEYGLTISAYGDVYGGYHGIYTTNEAFGIGFETGAMIITTHGTVTGNLRYGIAVEMYSGSNLAISSYGDVYGGETGICLRYKSTAGYVTITTTGNVTGKTKDGMAFGNFYDNSPVTITATGDIYGGRHGIYMGGGYYDYGSGPLSITTSGAVTGKTGNGISIEYGSSNSSPSANLTVNDVYGGQNGIYISHYGTDGITITSNGTVTGVGNDGIWAYNDGTGLTISANHVTGGDDGIYAKNHGGGAISVTATGTVTGGTGNGIYSNNNVTYSTDTIISVNHVYGYENGIIANNAGTGVLSITAGGTVEGQTIDGINAHEHGGPSLSISANNVYGGDDGIDATTSSISQFASLSITTTGTVTGADMGIRARVGNNGTYLAISANTVYGGTHGIHAESEGIEGIAITASGTVDGQTEDGIYAALHYNYNYDIAISISANNVSGGRNGIYSTTYYSTKGAADITTSGTVTGNAGSGIYAKMPDDISITVGAASKVYGNIAAITANSGSGGASPISITVNGTVSNLSGLAGDAAITATGGPTTITLNDGSQTTGQIALDDYDDTFNWNGGTLTGDFSGADGSDTAVISNTAQFDGSQILDGGADTDTLTFSAISASTPGTSMQNWEVVEVDNASLTLTDGFLEAGDGSAGTGLFLQNGASLYTGPVALDVTAEVEIDATSTLYHAMGGDIFGNVTNAGTIYWQNLNQTLTVNGDYHGVSGSRISLETYLEDDSSATDIFHVTGDTTGTTGLVVRAATGSPGGQTIDGIEVIQVDGTSAAGSFTLASAVQAGVYEYILQQGGAVTGGQNWYLVSNYTVPGSAGSNVVIYRPGVANYVGGQQVNNLQGLLQLSTFHQRIGGQFEVDRAGRRTWLRPYYAYQSAEGETRFDFEASFAGMQIGQELMAWEKDGVADRFALTFDFAYTDADFEDRKRPAAGLSEKTGNLDGYSYALGGIWTRTGDAGGYFDAVGQVSWLDNRYHDCYGDDATQHGWRFAVSAEAGKPVVQWLGWQLEPQGQLSYLYTTYEDFSDAASGVSGYDSQALVGRAGIRIFHGEAYKKDDGLQVYGIGNIVYHFIDPASVEIDSTDLEEEYSRTSWEAGAGIIGKVTPAIYVYGDARYEHAFDSTDTYGCRLNAGLRITF